MSEVKYCPDCNTEYYAHISECADCRVDLITPQELEELNSKHNLFKKSGEAGVAVREGEREWIKELSQVLNKKGVSSLVTGSPHCTPGKCGDSYFLIVPEGESEAALHLIEEYFHELHPQLKASKEASGEGKCPACGHDTGPEATECPDCGLFLVM